MGTVHVVATPIGNLEDVTLRALRVLGEADLVFAEDTRRTRVLLERHGVAARPVSLHSRNEGERIARALAVLAGGGSLALVSDAGTPLVSDPGAKLVAAALAEGHRVEPVPGASAVMAALVCSGLPPSPFVFLGFPPRKPGALRRFFEAHRERSETLVLFESPHRVAATLTAAAEVLGPRRAALARELTKLHEEVARGGRAELAERFREGARGECTLVLEGATVSQGPRSDAEACAEESLEEQIRARLERGERPREIAAALAARTGVPRRLLYARALAARDGEPRA